MELNSTPCFSIKILMVHPQSWTVMVLTNYKSCGAKQPVGPTRIKSQILQVVHILQFHISWKMYASTLYCTNFKKKNKSYYTTESIRSKSKWYWDKEVYCSPILWICETLLKAIGIWLLVAKISNICSTRSWHTSRVRWWWSIASDDWKKHYQELKWIAY